MGKIDALVQYLGFKGVKLTPAAKRELEAGKGIDFVLQGDTVTLSKDATGVTSEKIHKLNLADGINELEEKNLKLSLNDVERAAEERRFDETSKAQTGPEAKIFDNVEATTFIQLIGEYQKANRLATLEEAAKCWLAEGTSANYIDYAATDKRNTEIEQKIEPHLVELVSAPENSPAKALEIKNAKQATRAAFISQQTSTLQAEIGTTFSSPAPKDYAADQLIAWVKTPQTIQLKGSPATPAPATNEPPPVQVAGTTRLEEQLKQADACLKKGDRPGAIDALKKAQASTKHAHIKQGIQARIEKIELTPLAKEGQELLSLLSDTLLVLGDQPDPLVSYYEQTLKEFKLTASNKEEYISLLSQARKSIQELKERTAAKAQSIEANQLLTAKHYEPAKKLFDSIPIKQRKVNDWLGLGECFKKLGSDDKAVAIYRQGIEALANPKDKAVLEENIARCLASDLPPPPSEEDVPAGPTKKVVVVVPQTFGEFDLGSIKILPKPIAVVKTKEDLPPAQINTPAPPPLTPAEKPAVFDIRWFTNNSVLSSRSPNIKKELAETENDWVAWSAPAIQTPAPLKAFTAEEAPPLAKPAPTKDEVFAKVKLVGALVGANSLDTAQYAAAKTFLESAPKEFKDYSYWRALSYCYLKEGNFRAAEECLFKADGQKGGIDQANGKAYIALIRQMRKDELAALKREIADGKAAASEAEKKAIAEKALAPLKARGIAVSKRLKELSLSVDMVSSLNLTYFTLTPKTASEYEERLAIGERAIAAELLTRKRDAAEKLIAEAKHLGESDPKIKDLLDKQSAALLRSLDSDAKYDEASFVLKGSVAILKQRPSNRQQEKVWTALTTIKLLVLEKVFARHPDKTIKIHVSFNANRQGAFTGVDLRPSPPDPKISAELARLSFPGLSIDPSVFHQFSQIEGAPITIGNLESFIEDQANKKEKKDGDLIRVNSNRQRLWTLLVSAGYIDQQGQVLPSLPDNYKQFQVDYPFTPYTDKTGKFIDPKQELYTYLSNMRPSSSDTLKRAVAEEFLFDPKTLLAQK